MLYNFCVMNTFTVTIIKIKIGNGVVNDLPIEQLIVTAEWKYQFSITISKS